ncbi:MAG: DNA-directed RNA polymerase subunit alpha C-terminal domain-containing protein [Bacteroidota bacterium]
MDSRLEQIVNRSIASLQLSEEFKNAMRKHGFYTLNEIMSLPLKQLVKMTWFTKEMLEELSQFIFNARNAGSEL